MKQAFISVSDKSGLESLANTLIQHNISLIASDGTAGFLQERGIKVRSVSDYLNVSPILDGRVKTLHPHIFGGILADRDKLSHMSDLESLDIALIDYVIVDLYPFQAHLDIEHIDIGGISLIRAAAKNYQHCTVISEPCDYATLTDELETQGGTTRITFRKQLAARAFYKSSAYDASIGQWFLNTSNKSLLLTKTLELSYGENPHQAAGFYTLNHESASFKLIQGKPLSYNNLLDLDAGIHLISAFEQPATAIVKHTNPCGVALGDTVFSAVTRAMHADMKSAFGGIVVLNQLLDAQSALFLTQHFIELIAAPDYSEEALIILKNKPNCRFVQFNINMAQADVLKSALNGFLIQTVDKRALDFDSLSIPTRAKPNALVLPDLAFAFQIARCAKSNAIVIAKQGVSVSIGAGQTNRVDATLIAINKAHGHDLQQAVLASDGFFPFADSIEQIAATQINTIIQPGGSIRDNEVIDACDRFGISMVFANIRGFKH